MVITLNDYMPRPQRVTETSKESYKDINLDPTTQGQVGYVENILRNREDGCTDWELCQLLKDRGINIPLSSVAARRNDVNRKYAKTHSTHVVVWQGDVRENPITRKANRVWRWRDV